MNDDLIRRPAREIVAALTRGDLTPHDALDAIEARIGDVDGMVNALPTLCFDRARADADRMVRSAPADRGLLAGLPVPIKDLNAVAGVRNTFGSKIREHWVPETSDLLVEHLESAGAIVYAMSNTPEFGAGGNTFNDVFGPTRNPHDLRLTAGGSSGGAAAALASGSAWLAHGSDLAGSLRTPASFCGITSLRPSPGLIASGPSAVPFLVHPQQGPMARDIADLALFTDAMVGLSSRAGLSQPRPLVSFRDAASQPVRPVRVAFSRDLGITDTDDVVAAVCARAMACLERDGIEVIDDHPDLGEAALAFDVPRALMYATLLGSELPTVRHILKPELVWNIEQGLELDGASVRASLGAQGRLFNHAAAFMAGYDLLICPAAITTPFPVEERYVGYSDGLAPSAYFQWLAIASAVTATTLPVVTIPCGCSDEGLPVGLQLIGRPHGELALFGLASHLEALFDFGAAVVDPTPLPAERSAS